MVVVVTNGVQYLASLPYLLHKHRMCCVVVWYRKILQSIVFFNFTFLYLVLNPFSSFCTSYIFAAVFVFK